MLVENMEQGSDAWHEFRRNHIGASDAPIIMGVSPWRSKEELWKEKLGLGPQQFDNPWMQRGRELEPIARQVYCDMKGCHVSAAVVVSDEYNWMSASFDGISECGKYAVEIKCSGNKDHQLAKQGLISEKYVPQLQHQMCVANLQEIDYFSFDGNEGIIIQLKRDQEYIDKLIEEELKFWECVQNFTMPETKQNYVLKDDDLWNSTALEWKLANAEMKVLEAKEKVLREQLIMLSNNQNSRGGNVRVTNQSRKGAIDLERLFQDLKIDLEKYRKPDVSFWKISEEK